MLSGYLLRYFCMFVLELVGHAWLCLVFTSDSAQGSLMVVVMDPLIDSLHAYGTPSVLE